MQSHSSKVEELSVEEYNVRATRAHLANALLGGLYGAINDVLNDVTSRHGSKIPEHGRP